jgi:hypothetical protein
MQKLRLGCFGALALLGIAAFVLLNYSVITTTLFWIILTLLCPIAVLVYTFTSVAKVTDVSMRPIPARLQKSHKKLLALGFTPIGTVGVQEFFIPYRVWGYLSQDKFSHAYIGGLSGSTWFSSYFAKGIDLTTRYQGGVPVSNEKFKESIVGTSLEATFDYHLQQIESHANLWGNPLVFETLQEQVAWEKQHKTNEAINYSFIKGFLWGVVRYAFALAITMPIFFLWIYPNSEPNFLTFMIFFAFIPLIFAMMPLFRSSTVEARKKKKLDEKEKPLA